MPSCLSDALPATRRPLGCSTPLLDTLAIIRCPPEARHRPPFCPLIYTARLLLVTLHHPNYSASSWHLRALIATLQPLDFSAPSWTPTRSRPIGSLLLLAALLGTRYPSGIPPVCEGTCCQGGHTAARMPSYRKGPGMLRRRRVPSTDPLPEDVTGVDGWPGRPQHGTRREWGGRGRRGRARGGGLGWCARGEMRR